MSSTVLILYYVWQIMALALLGLPVIYLLFFAFAGIFYRQRDPAIVPGLRKFVVLVPSYKEDEVIVETAVDALMQEYPKDLFEVVVIADSLNPATISTLRKLPVTVIEVRFDRSTKTKALNSAMALLSDTYDIAVVLDADNLMNRDFLSRINSSFTDDLAAIQGHRTARNLDTPLAILDAASEEINNHIFRKGHRASGLSSAIIGSGMAFRYDFFRELMSGIMAVGGFDKEIELTLLSQGMKIGYDDDAIVYDEKVRHGTAFTNQRRRWLSAQFNYFGKAIGPAFRQLFTRGNLDYFDKAIQFILPPRILLPVAFILGMIVFISANSLVGAPFLFDILWIAGFISCLLVFFFSVPLSFYNTGTARALLALPRGVILMLASLARVRGANQQFLHTRHGPSGPEKAALITDKTNQL
jgi:cellulose synthase/poly-beta-1,6-N-acetylglucosamine synthase-like glycosyltransferase